MKKMILLVSIALTLCGVHAQNDVKKQKLDKLNSFKLRLISEINVKSDSLKLINRLIDEIEGRELIGEIGGGREIKVKASTLGYIKKDTGTYSAVLAEFAKGDELTVLGFQDGKFLVRRKGVLGYTLEQNVSMNAELRIFKENLIKKENEAKRAEDEKTRKAEQERREREEQERRKRVIANYGNETGEKILGGYYWIGMTSEMAAESLGEPERKTRSSGASGGVIEQWDYPKSNIYLFFDNGTLKRYQKSK
jgi:hypothetical protein